MHCSPGMNTCPSRYCSTKHVSLNWIRCQWCINTSMPLQDCLDPDWWMCNYDQLCSFDWYSCITIRFLDFGPHWSTVWSILDSLLGPCHVCPSFETFWTLNFSTFLHFFSTSIHHEIRCEEVGQSFGGNTWRLVSITSQRTWSQCFVFMDMSPDSPNMS